EDARAVGNRVLHRGEDLRGFEHDVGTTGGWTRVWVGPTVPGRDEAQLGEAEVEHRPRRLADVLSELRTDKDDDGLGCGLSVAHKSRSGEPCCFPEPDAGSSVRASSPTASTISAKSPGSL